MTATDFFTRELNPLFDVAIIDIIDIVIVAFVIYKISSWLKGTRARSLLKGIFVVLIIYGTSSSNILDLTTVFWLTDSFFNVGIITMVVVFQPELRKMLEEIGRGKLSAKFVEAEDNAGLARARAEIIAAIELMSKEKTGALILVEREDPLDDIIKTGTHLDAIVTRQLLLSIFDHHTPLHDGAIVIRGERIIAASCILPLTETEIGKDLGTRHRAATGASEAYDSISIVVSEETGKISFAKDSKIVKHVNTERIEKLLKGSSKQTQKRKFVIWSNNS